MKKGHKSASNLVPIRPGGYKPPLFWVHGDASNAYLEKYLDVDRPFYAFKHQGRHGETSVHAKVETIAAYYLEQMFSVQKDGPYFLGGYSFGGTVAFEMARQLEKKSQRVALLFMIDSLSPGTHIDDKSAAESPSAASIQSVDAHPRDVHRHWNTVSRLKPWQIVDYVMTRVNSRLKQKLVMATRIVKKLLIKIYVRTGRPLPYFLRSQFLLKIYYDAIAKYAPLPYRGQAVYIKSERRATDHSARWRRLILGGLVIHEVPGCSHMEIIKDIHAPFWAEKLRDCLTNAHERESDVVNSQNGTRPHPPKTSSRS